MFTVQVTDPVSERYLRPKHETSMNIVFWAKSGQCVTGLKRLTSNKVKDEMSFLAITKT